MESTFSSPAEAALQREAGSAGLRTPLGDLDRVYELERVVGFVRDLGCQRVRTCWGADGSARGSGSWGNFVRLGMWGDASLMEGLGRLGRDSQKGFP